MNDEQRKIDFIIDGTTRNIVLKVVINENYFYEELSLLTINAFIADMLVYKVSSTVIYCPKH